MLQRPRVLFCGRLSKGSILLVLFLSLFSAGECVAKQSATELRGALIAASDASLTRLEQLKASGMNTVVFALRTRDRHERQSLRVAFHRARQLRLAVAYWVEVARSPQLADEHPAWMASLQTHDEWRRLFPGARKPKPHEVTKAYPWVPILSREPHKAQRERVLALLNDLPTPQLILLNDLQGAPSACGCGNALCRWTSDYGDRRTTIPLGDDAAALFVQAIQRALPESEVIPVWTTECERHDGSPDGLCAGVGCFEGICWKAYTRQLMPVAEISDRIGVLATYKQFQRDSAHYGDVKASWIDFVIKTFATMPPKNQGKSIPASRLIAIVQGWDVTSTEIEAQRDMALRAGANGYVVAYDKIEQSWTPRVVSWR